MPNELVIKAPEGFEFIDDGTVEEVVKGDVRHIPPPPKQWTVKEIYGRDVTIPEGWSYVAFRPWTSGEWFLDKFDRIPTDSGVADDRPRIIVKKKEVGDA